MPIMLTGLLSVCRVDGQSQPGFAVDFVVPIDSTNQDGNTYSVPPVFHQPFTIRYQQVYSAGEFAYLTNFIGGWLFGVVFRGDGTNGTQVGVNMPNVQVDFSTTQRGPDQLSDFFGDNVGADNTVVFAGTLQTSVIGSTSGGKTSFSSFQIPFSKMFYYNPTAGNLLFDMRIFQGNTNTNIEARLDAWNRTNDSVSRVWAGDVNASTGLAETIGLATELLFWPNPKLHIEQQANSVDLWWPANPTSFVFQTTQNLLPQTQWQDITGGIVRSNAINTYKVSLDSAGAAAFFRLISRTPP